MYKIYKYLEHMVVYTNNNILKVKKLIQNVTGSVNLLP